MDHNLYPWQPAGVEFLRTHPGGLLADKQGLGKTVMFISAAKNFNGPILVVCRPLAKLQTAKMIKEWDPEATVVRCVEGGVFAEEVVEKWFNFPRTRGYLLVHHEIVYRIAAKLRAMGVWEIICVDEAHRISNPRAQVTKAVKTIPAFYKWGMSGTIMDKSPADFWSLLHWFQPQKFTSYWAFHGKYVDEIRNAKSGQVVKTRPKNLVQFGNEVGPYYLQRNAAEVGMQEPLYETIYLEMYPKQQKVYDTLAKETLAYIEREWTDDPIFVQNALQKIHLLQWSTISTSLVGVPGPSVKFDYILDWIKDYPDEQCVIFTHSKDASKELARIIDNSACLNGDTPNKTRDIYMEKFKNKEFNVLIVVTDLAAESISLSWVSTAFFLDIHPSSRMMSQAEMRIRRADSTRRAKIYFLVCNETVDEHLIKLYQEKTTNREAVEQFLRRYHEIHSHK